MSVNAISNGWLTESIRCPSPNFNSRPAEVAVRLIVVHNISLPPCEFGTGQVQRFFCNQLDATAHPYYKTIAHLQVSAHLFIERTGVVTQFVSFDQRAWHAGASRYLGVSECNDYSIGIELEGADNVPYSDAQYDALAKVVAAIQAHYPQCDRHVTGHSDIAPGRKTDPSPSFDWQRFRSLLALGS